MFPAPPALPQLARTATSLSSLLFILAVAQASLAPPASLGATAHATDVRRDGGEVRTGSFPFLAYAARHEFLEFTPLDQGGRLVQLQVIGSERDEDVVRAVRTPGFFSAWGNPIGWDALEKEQVEKSVWLNRWYFLPSFARQYHLTGDATLLEDVMAFVRRWRAENPPPDDVRAYIQSKRRNWRDMQVAWRVQNLAWCYFLGGDGFTAAERKELFTLIDEHAQVLLEDFGTRTLNENNHQSHGATTMLFAALLFPEVRNAAALRTKAVEILEHHLAHAFFEDGNSVEQCPGYYPFFVSIFRDAHLLCRANDVEPPARSEERLRQFYHYLGRVAQPDGTMPPINDSSESESAPSLRVLAELLGEPFPYPAPRSHRFAASHQAIMRDLDPGAPTYVFLDAGPHVVSHWHGGKLGFHLWYWGRPLLVDSGVSNYDDPLRRQWYLRPQAHNTILVDGRGDYDPTTILRSRRPAAGSRIEHWETTQGFDWAVMKHEGFPDREAPVEWTRHFVLLKGVGCVVVDHLESTVEHDYTWLFHLPPSTPSVDAGAGTVFTGFAEKNLLLRAAKDAPLRLEMADGWVNRRSRNYAAPVATYTLRADRTVQAFLLLPVGGASAPAARLTQSSGPDGVTVEITVDGRTSRLQFAREGASAEATHRLTLSSVDN